MSVTRIVIRGNANQPMALVLTFKVRYKLGLDKWASRT